MSAYVVQINRVVTNGPYAYILFKDGVGVKDSNTLASISAAMSAVQTDIGGMLGTETVSRVQMTVTSA